MSLPAQLEHCLALPLIQAPMFLVSNPELALACCRNGVMGSFPALNQRSSDAFEAWLQIMQSGLDQLKDGGIVPAPYAVNLIVHDTNPRLAADVALCVKYRVPVVITSLGAASQVIEAVHSYGGIVFHDVANVRHARKAAAAGVDGLITVCNGAGGHAGILNPFAFVAELRNWWDKTIIMSGCLSRGDDILAAQAMGADLAYMGTRFIATEESAAQEEYKQMICQSHADDIVYTPEISGIPASFMGPSLELAGFDIAELKKWQPGAAGKLKAIADEAKAWKNIWSAGQGVSAIHSAPATDQLCQQLKAEYTAAQLRIAQ